MNFKDIFKRLKPLKAPWKNYYQKGKDTIKVPNDTIYEFFEKSAIKYSECTAYEYFGKKTSYKNFLKQIDETAKAFKAIGVKKKDIITICMPNTPEAIMCFYALNKLGAISNMIHPLSAEEEIKDYLNGNHAKMIVLIDMCLEKVNNILRKTKVKKAIVVSPGESMPFFLNVGYGLTQGRKFKKPNDPLYINWKEFIKYGKTIGGIETVPNKKDTPAVILHSGGTTGTPKATLLTNESFSTMCLQIKYVIKEINEKDSLLAIMPIFHGFGLSICINAPFFFGAKAILVPQFNAKEFDKLINKTKPTIIVGVPTLYEALTNSNNIKDLDLSYVKYVISGGDFLSGPLFDKINNYFQDHGSKAVVFQGYGMTESLAATSVAANEWNKKGSIGIPLPGNHLKIVDPETRKELGINEDGEICVTGPTLMLGYLDNEIETNEVLQIHDDGHVWLHTGDIGYMDEDGVFFYKQRLKRMIISSGYNVYPSHIENIINEHPAVLSSTVIGVPHPYKVEVPKAFVVLKNDYISLGSTEKSIKKWCEKHLSRHAVPHEFEFRKSLPKTLIGKIDFKKLMAEEEEKRKNEK